MFNKSVTLLLQYPQAKTGDYVLPGTVAAINDWAFYGCPNLTSVTLPPSLITIGRYAFSDCANLTTLYFQGNASAVDWTTFSGDNLATAYFLPGTTGWGPTFGGLSTALWYLPYPVILTGLPSFGVQTNQFGFIISWAYNPSVVVEACTNLAYPIWSAVSTNLLTDGWSHFSDPQWRNYRSRFYRARSL